MLNEDKAKDKLIEEMRAHNSLRYRLETLTPGGSEFHDNPDHCFEWIKDRLSTIVTICKERNSVRDENTRLRAQLATAKDYLERIRLCTLGEFVWVLADNALKELEADK